MNVDSIKKSMSGMVLGENASSRGRHGHGACCDIDDRGGDVGAKFQMYDVSGGCPFLPSFSCTVFTATPGSPFHSGKVLESHDIFSTFPDLPNPPFQTPFQSTFPDTFPVWKPLPFQTPPLFNTFPDPFPDSGKSAPFHRSFQTSFQE